MSRWRIAYRSNRHSDVDLSCVVSETEAETLLDAEFMLHQMLGWVVTRNGKVVVARHPLTRVVRVAEAVEVDPMNDRVAAC